MGPDEEKETAQVGEDAKTVQEGDETEEEDDDDE